MSTIQDVKAKPVMVTFTDGTEHEIKFTLNALALLEEKYGSVDDALGKLDSGSFVAIRYLLWAAMQHEENPLTETQVGNLLDINALGNITDALTSAAEGGMPTEAQIEAVAGPVPLREAEAPNN